jgi:myo-inositol-1(or 4)-monophosphatase
MKKTDFKKALATAVQAARDAGQLMVANRRRVKKINLAVQHDIKLELDVRCQKRIERILLGAFPQTAVLGEEGAVGDIASSWRWVVDPIDGTVNFAHDIPHACVSIALQRRVGDPKQLPQRPGVRDDDAAYETVVGVVYDPFCEELWTAILGGPARLNGRVIRVSTRSRMEETIVSLGFAKSRETLNKTLPAFNRLIHRVRKIRIMGAAALAMTYVASGRMDAYVEAGVRLWDLAAGGLILECAGGEYWRRQLPGKHVYEVVANNGLIRRKLERVVLPRG